MELNTKISFPSFESKINYATQSVFMGSCFSENIGGWLKEMKFNAQSNICGIAYNPISIAKHISRSLESDFVIEKEMLLSRENYVHPDFHSCFNHPDPKIGAQQINDSIRTLGKELHSCSILFLTFGTSIVFELKSSGETVANCHHLPSRDFSKKMLHEDDMLDAMDEAFEKLKKVNPNLRIVLTVSPIRHLRHGAIENSRSKSRLIRLCEMIESKHSNTTYLPIFEYVMDELRDYRFYRQDDFIHLNELGIGLIREKFTEFLISDEAFPMMSRVKKWRSMKAHKIVNPNSSQAIEFMRKLKDEEQEIQKLLDRRC